MILLLYLLISFIINCYILSSVLKIRRYFKNYCLTNSLELKYMKERMEGLINRDDLDQITNRVDERIEHLGHLSVKKNDEKWEAMRKIFSKKKGIK